MVAAEEERIKEREKAIKDREERDRNAGKKVKKHDNPEHGENKSNAQAP